MLYIPPKATKNLRKRSTIHTVGTTGTVHAAKFIMPRMMNIVMSLNFQQLFELP